MKCKQTMQRKYYSREKIKNPFVYAEKSQKKFKNKTTLFM